MLTYATTSVPTVALPPVPLDVHISYGQSWRSNSFPDFNGFGLNPLGPLAFLGSDGTPMPGNVGIFLSTLPKGVTNYRGSDPFMIGRCAVLAQQLLRIRDGSNAVSAELEFCTAFPASSWRSGLGGGLAPGASFTGSIAGLTLTVDSITAGYVTGGQVLVATGVDPSTRVNANLTLADADADISHLHNPDGLSPEQLIPGGVGTYQLNIAFTCLEANFTGTGPAAVFRAWAQYGTLFVVSITSGSLAVNQVIVGGGCPVGTIIQQQLSGPTGGVGNYLLGLPQTVTSRAMQAKGTSWTNMLTILSTSAPGQGALPTKDYSRISVSSVGYTQGGSISPTEAAKVFDLTDMMVQFDALNLNAVPLRFYLGVPAPVSNTTTNDVSTNGTHAFCRTHAPGMGGTYSGRVFGSGPSYPYQFNGGDNIHTGDYGTSRWGEIEGYVRWLVQDKGVQWTPLWRPLTGGAITRAGQVLTVPWARPAGPDFVAGIMTFQSNADDGIKVWPQNGFHVKRGGTDLTVTPTISGMNVLLAVTETINASDTLEVSYAWYGPGGPSPGISTGVGGNLVMRGPPSVLYPNGWNGVAKTIECWAWSFIETVTV